MRPPEQKPHECSDVEAITLSDELAHWSAAHQLFAERTPFAMTELRGVCSLRVEIHGILALW
jgi:hypothetical protein